MDGVTARRPPEHQSRMAEEQSDRTAQRAGTEAKSYFWCCYLLFVAASMHLKGISVASLLLLLLFLLLLLQPQSDFSPPLTSKAFRLDCKGTKRVT